MGCVMTTARLSSALVLVATAQISSRRRTLLVIIRPIAPLPNQIPSGRPIMPTRLWVGIVACLCVLCGVAGLLPLSHAQPPSTIPPNGLRDNTPAVHALINARIVVAPGRTIEKATLVIRDGVVTAVGADVAAPSDARVWDLSGKTIYPGLIDAYGEPGPVGGGGAARVKDLLRRARRRRLRRALQRHRTN